jgi:hypothetical protein
MAMAISRFGFELIFRLPFSLGFDRGRPLDSREASACGRGVFRGRGIEERRRNDPVSAKFVEESLGGGIQDPAIFRVE